MNNTKKLGICLCNHNCEVEYWLINNGATFDYGSTFELFMDMYAVHGIDITTLGIVQKYLIPS
jgi:hypothetical protein